MMKTLLWPNMEREEGLFTVHEVPIPEQAVYSFLSPKNIKSIISGRNAAAAEIQLLLGVVGAPLIPHPIPSHPSSTKNINDHPIEMSMAKYIVHQYIAAAGGENALRSIGSLYAMGKVKMGAAEFRFYEEEGNMGLKKKMKMKRVKSAGEMGGFVVWEKRPNMWSLEMVVSGCKISAGSDGKVAWRHTPWHNSHTSRGPPRPLRRTLQGLDPMSTANLFSNSICTGEKMVNGQDCFVLKLEAEPTVLKARSSTKLEIIKHTVWGYFSQRFGLLVQLQDSQLLRIKSPENDDITWETNTASLIHDYRTLNGVNIAHAGKTLVSLCRLDRKSEAQTVTRMEEAWTIDEVDFNVKGLSIDFFLPPSDLMN